MKTEIDVIIIGVSQAGLAAAHFLKEKNISFLIIGKEQNIGDVWRNRYDSLVLFTPRCYSSLPGLPLEGDPNGFATKNEMFIYRSGIN
ncbi:cation diffusion facilitator CzcD-associated flavoprotein CzcO [Paenibacillus sp. V4I7]|nr:cation diffusion facilitator CzcD-associated flavoprotein CzcO [Paenibacillus sp. V4I7]MDQ0920747.1 cation diffusion facilitator CzcD-associated flavoprotein CzcO [Paenibacillus sp. V4I5]